jgi:hypothetical protein
MMDDLIHNGQPYLENGQAVVANIEDDIRVVVAKTDKGVITVTLVCIEEDKTMHAWDVCKNVDPKEMRSRAQQYNAKQKKVEESDG